MRYWRNIRLYLANSTKNYRLAPHDQLTLKPNRGITAPMGKDMNFYEAQNLNASQLAHFASNASLRSFQINQTTSKTTTTT